MLLFSLFALKLALLRISANFCFRIYELYFFFVLVSVFVLCQAPSIIKFFTLSSCSTCGFSKLYFSFLLRISDNTFTVSNGLFVLMITDARLIELSHEL